MLLAARGDIGPLAWLMFGALAAAAIVLGALRSEHRFAAPAALGFALLLIASRAGRDGEIVLWAAAATSLMFAASSIALALRGDRMLHGAIAAAALAGPAAIVRALRPDLGDPPTLALLMLVPAAAALLHAWLQRAHAREDKVDLPLFLAAAAAALLAGLAIVDLLPADLVPAGWLAVAIGLALLGRRLGDRGFAIIALATAGFAAVRAAATVPQLWITAQLTLLGQPAYASHLPTPGTALIVLALPAALLLALAVVLRNAPSFARRSLLGAAAVFGLAALYVLAKQAFGIASREDFAARGFAERTVITQTLFAIGWLLASGRLRLGRLDEGQAAWLGSAITLVAAARLIWFDMLIHNPVLDEQWVGGWPILNLILPSYLLGAFWLYAARRRADAQTRSGFWLGAFLVAAVAGVMLEVRQLFHGGWLNAPEISVAEAYGYSLAGLALSVALLLAGFRLPGKALRLAGLVLLTLTILKVFLSDFSALEGVLRILSFLGLGIALIGIGRLYAPVLRAERGGKDGMVGATGFEPATPTPPV
jgi:uncharacterized membrane protein